MRDPKVDLFADRYSDIRMQVRIYLRHQFRNLVDIEEIADAAMEKLFVRWEAVDNPLAWVITAAKNLARDELRKAPVAQLDEEVVNANGTRLSTSGNAGDQIDILAILHALRSLSPSQHQVVVLAALGFTNREIADFTRLTPNSAAHYLCEGRKNLEKILQYRRRKPKHPRQTVRPPDKS